MTQKEKFKTGNYIRVAKSRTYSNIPFEKLDNDDNYWLEREFEYFFIHKKHKDILDAYLLDNSVEIEQCSNGDWYEININPYYDAFIRFYDENNEYRLKQKIETIQAPNSKTHKEEYKCTEFEMSFINEKGRKITIKQPDLNDTVWDIVISTDQLKDKQ